MRNLKVAVIKCSRLFKYNFIFFLFSVSVFDAIAEEPTKQRLKSSAPISSSYWYLSLGQASIDTKIATQQGVKNSSTYIRLGWEGQNKKFVYGAGMSGFLYSDREKFSQTVRENIGGNVRSASSSADAFNLYGEAGYNHWFTNHINLGILGGYEWVLQSERGIANCTDCRSEDIDISSGLYLYPRLMFRTGKGFGLTLGYHHYLTGDVRNAISISAGGGVVF